MSRYLKTLTSPARREYELPILVPIGRSVQQVIVDGQIAIKTNTLHSPGATYSIENWVVMLDEPPLDVAVRFNPVRL